MNEKWFSLEDQMRWKLFKITTDEFDYPEATARGELKRGDGLYVDPCGEANPGDLVLVEQSNHSQQRLVRWERHLDIANLMLPGETILGPVRAASREM